MRSAHRLGSLRILTAGLIALAMGGLCLVASAGPAHAGAFPGPNGLIVFESDVNGCCHLFTVHPDGSGLQQVTHVGLNFDPAWSPGGKLIAFARDTGQSQDIYTMQPDGSHVHRVTWTGCEDYSAFSPDGRWLVASHWPGTYPDCFINNPDLYIIHPDGTGRHKLTHTPELRELLAEWAPNGTQIAYSAHSDGSFDDYHVYVINRDGTGTAQITPDDTPSLFPDWSPGSGSITYNAFLPNSRIWTVRPDGSGRKELTDPPALLSDFQPAYSPDGQRITFVSDRLFDERFDVFVMKADGTGIHRIVNSPTGTSPDMPDWGSNLGSTQESSLPPSSALEPSENARPIDVHQVLARLLRRS
jgi:Tol biopolymer transport system component